jgi:hypothetical protein
MALARSTLEDAMTDRVSASITLGGTLTASQYAELAEIIADEDLSLEWDGERFEPQHRTVGESLSLYAHEVAWGRFDNLESWCIRMGLPFARCSGAYFTEWGPERVVFTGRGEPTSYPTVEDDYVVIGRDAAEKLGSIAAILAYFDEADFVVPPLVVEGDPDTAGEA